MWNPVKELKVVALINFSKSDIKLVESGEGIERIAIMPAFAQTLQNLTWNPVKELKELYSQLLHAALQNHVESGEGIESGLHNDRDVDAARRRGMWNPVKELKVNFRTSPLGLRLCYVESGEGIESEE